MIKLESVYKSIDNKNILNNINLSLNKGEFTTIIGPGGSGKSFLLKTILGIYKPDEGNVELFGSDIFNISRDKISNMMKKVGVAFQKNSLFDDMSVKENLFFAMKNKLKLSKDQMLKKIIFFLTELNLVKTMDMYPFELSGGMKRRINVIRAMITDPSIAIFDDPISGLDPLNSNIILNMIKNFINTKDKIVLILTSNVDIAMKFCERTIIINKGKIIEDNNWKNIMKTGNKWIKKFLFSR